MTIPTVSVNRLWFGIALACLVSGCINRPGMNRVPVARRTIAEP
jgi:hypothetical protein